MGDVEDVYKCTTNEEAIIELVTVTSKDDDNTLSICGKF